VVGVGAKPAAGILLCGLSLRLGVFARDISHVSNVSYTSRKDRQRKAAKSHSKMTFELQLPYLKLRFSHAPNLACRVTDALTIEPDAALSDKPPRFRLRCCEACLNKQLGELDACTANAVRGHLMRCLMVPKSPVEFLLGAHGRID
jgi:hypothetical protein